MGKRYTVAVDFDGVIHSYTTPWIDAGTIPDPPVEGAIVWLNYIADEFDVVIFTTRGKAKEGQRAVRHYLHEHGVTWGMNATVTAEKVPALVYIDDRAFRFQGPGGFPTAELVHALRPWNKPPTSATGDSGAVPDPAPVSLSVQEGQGETLGASGARRAEEGNCG